MASKAIAGIGAEFRWLNGSVFETISEITNIGGPNKSRDTIDVTNLDSPDGYAEFIGGMRNGGEVPLDMNFTRATYELMDGLFESADLQDFQILLPDPEHTTVSFSGVVTALGLGIPANDKVSANVSIKVSGKPTINSGSSA